MKPTSLRRKAHAPTKTELRHTTNVTTSSLKELGGKGKRAKPSTVTTQYNEAWDDIAAVARRQSLKKKLLEKEQRASIKQIRVKGVEVSRPLALLTTCDELTDAELRALVDQAHGRVIARDDDIVNAATIKEMLRLPEPPALRPGLINIIVLCVLVRVFGSDPLSGITLRRVDAAAGFNLKVVEDDVTIRRLDGSFVATIIRGAGRWASESLFVGLGSVIERIEVTKRTKRELKDGVGPRATACKAYTVAGFVAHERTPHKPGSEKKVLAPRALNMSPEREILNRELAHKLAFVYSKVREFVYSEVRPHEIAMNKLMGIRFFDGHFKDCQLAIVDICEMEPHIFALALDYMYDGKILVRDSNALEQVLTAASVLQIDSLLAIVATEIAKNVTADNCASILACADRHHLPHLHHQPPPFTDPHLTIMCGGRGEG